MNPPDQLEIQCHLELTALRRQFADARRRVRTWEPAPTPTRSAHVQRKRTR